MICEQEIRAKWRTVTRRLIALKKHITTMESCTSGQLASLITDTEGSSAVMKGAFVTYSNEAKIAMGVPAETIGTYGVYSKETAIAMAETARAGYGADYAVGVTGSMGNFDPANKDSVPGEVYYAIADENGTTAVKLVLEPQPTRLEYKLLVADYVADALLEKLK